MKRLILIALGVALGFGSMAQDPAWEQGIKHFEASAFAEAAEAWKTIPEEARTADVWYNLGNAHYKQNQLGFARWCYEKCLLLDPSHEDAAFNNKILKAKLIDVIEDSPYTGIRSSFQEAVVSVGNASWTYLTIFLGLLGGIAWLLYWLGSSPFLRKWGLSIGISCTLLTGLGYMGAKKCLDITSNSPFGIVTSPKIDVFHAPNNSSSKAFILHEGIKVEIVKIVGAWQEIKISNGQSGWIEGKHLIRL